VHTYQSINDKQATLRTHHAAVPTLQSGTKNWFTTFLISHFIMKIQIANFPKHGKTIPPQHYESNKHLMVGCSI
jgi:hypothetical protein